MEIRAGQLFFPKQRGGGPDIRTDVHNFQQPVAQAVAMLQGTRFGFSAPDDHHLGLAKVRLDTAIDDDVVTVTGKLGVRDWSGDWDDNYEGSIQYVLLVDLAPPAAPSNLSITGVEATQGIQFFRSTVDASQRRDDNSIGLVAGKDTVLRVYVDNAGLATRPPISSVSGVLEVRPPASSTWVPINPLNSVIPPIKDSQIVRTNRDHTLNFRIEGFLTTGRLEYRVRAFDPTNPALPGATSPSRTGTLDFLETAPFRIRAVGIRYTGTNATAPTPIAALPIATMRTLAEFVEQTFPVSRVDISGYAVLDFDGDLTSDDTHSDLVEDVNEMRGDNPDTHYGMIPANVVLGGWLGQANGKAAAGAATVVDANANCAHELGHTCGRSHPCGAGPDENYPNYGVAGNASIGEVGITPGGAIRDPLNTMDFMAQFSCQAGRGLWVSPYTYEGLRSCFPSVASGANLSKRRSAMEPIDTLFLSLRIYHGVQVNLRPSFHYPARVVDEIEGQETRYTVLLYADDGRLLRAAPLVLRDPAITPDAAVLAFYQPIEFHPYARRLTVDADCGDCRGHKEIFKTEIPAKPPEAPICEVTDKARQPGCLRVTWEGDATRHYLVRYSPDGGHDWIGLSPRLNGTSFEFNPRYLPASRRGLIQVLVSDGLRTSAATQELNVDSPDLLIDIARPNGSLTPDDTITAEAWRPASGSIAPEGISWTSDRQGAVGRGTRLPAARLRRGHHRLTVTAEEVSRDLEVDVEGTALDSRRTKHTSKTHPGHTSKDHERGRIKED